MTGYELEINVEMFQSLSVVYCNLANSFHWHLFFVIYETDCSYCRPIYRK